LAISFNIPGLLRIVLVRAPNEIVAYNDAVGIDRPLSGRGGLINRMIAGKFAPFRGIDGGPWPAFASRLDPYRSAGQESLEQKLSRFDELLPVIANEIAALGAIVRDDKAPMPVGVLVQQAVGRLFFADYAATAESYKAAVLASGWLSAGPLKSLYIRCTGRLRAALDRLTELSHGDVYCAHATALALHNIVESVEAMRQLARSGNALNELAPAEIATRTLRAPPRIIREARDAGSVGSTRHRARSLILLSVESARKRGSDAGAFFDSRWNQCPAHTFVPKLLAEIWRAAQTSH
jgi:hypothetical protein